MLYVSKYAKLLYGHYIATKTSLSTGYFKLTTFVLLFQINEWNLDIINIIFTYLGIKKASRYLFIASKSTPLNYKKTE